MDDYYKLLLARYQMEEAQFEFHFQAQQATLRKKVEEALLKPSPPYILTVRECGLVEDRLCENMNK